MSDHLKQALFHLKKIPLPGAAWIGFREVREKLSIFSARDGHPETLQSTLSHGVMAEVLVNGQFGYASTPHLDSETLAQTALRAYEQAHRASRFSIHHFRTSERPPTQMQYASPREKSLNHTPPSEIISLLVEISKKLKISPKIIRTDAYAEVAETEITLLSSTGANAHQELSFITTDFDALAQEGSVVQRRTDGGMRGKSRQGGWEYLWTADLWARVQKVAEEALELAAAPPCPTETCDLILMPDQMMLQIHESIGHPLEIDRILGDERNYAGWSFVKQEDFGCLQYGSHLLNVTFDPTLPSEFASFGFDDIGAPARREFLIRDGILLRGLGGLESEARSKIPGVANARSSSWNRPPIDRMANLNLEPGTSSFEEIISSVKRGVLMTSNRSWSIDDFRNKFQFGCEYAKCIENGKLTMTLRNPNYRGISVPFWNSLKKVGNASTIGIFGTPYCGKGEPNQSIRVGHASPVCLFENVEVFGGTS